MIQRYTGCGKRVCTLLTSLKASSNSLYALPRDLSSVPRDLADVPRDQQYRRGFEGGRWWGLLAGGVLAASVIHEANETDSNAAPSSTIPNLDTLLSTTDDTSLSVPPHLLTQLDEWYTTGQYSELMSLLDSFADIECAELLWRRARAEWQILKSVGQDPSILGRSDRVSQIQGLVDLLDRALELDERCSAAHHWKAVLSNACSGSAGLKNQFKNLETMRYHLEQAIELDPTDTDSMTLLGAWHMELLELSWVQRNFISLFCTFPNCSYEQALELFLRAEQLAPAVSLSNSYLTGKACFRLGRKTEAKRFLEQALNCRAVTKEDQIVLEEAKRFYNSSF